MPFGNLLSCFADKAGDMAEQYGGETARNLVEDGIEKLNVGENEAEGANAGGGLDVDSLMQVFSGKQQGGLTSLFTTLAGSLGGLESKASEQGMDPNLITTVMGLIGGGGSGGSEGGSGGFDLGSLLEIAKVLTQGGGAGGFLKLIGGGGEGSGKISEILIGLAKSFFAMKMGKNKALQDWGSAGAESNQNDDNVGKWTDSLIGDLVFPDKKPKDIVQDDEDPKGKDTNPDDVKNWVDKNPEIGKMQKEVFDDIFDTTDEDEDEERKAAEEAPLIPTPVGFQPDCSILDNVSILFLNNKILLELRKTWRFLYSSKTSDRDFVELSKSIQYEGPTLIVVRTTNDTILGAFCSTSWAETEGGWVGNGDSFLFTINPKMSVFYSTGQNENFMFLDQGTQGLGMGGKVGHFGFGIKPDMETLDYNEDTNTFDLPVLPGGSTFEIDHVEVWGLGPQPRAEEERAKVEVRKPDLDIEDGGNVDMNDLMGQIC